MRRKKLDLRADTPASENEAEALELAARWQQNKLDLADQSGETYPFAPTDGVTQKALNEAMTVASDAYLPEDKPWVQGQRRKLLTPSEYIASLIAGNGEFVDKRERAKAEQKWNNYLGKIERGTETMLRGAGATLETGVDFTRLLAKYGIEIPYVAAERGVKKYALAKMLGDEWNTDAGATFRWNNSSLGRGPGTYWFGARETVMGGDTLAKEYPHVFGGKGDFPPLSLVSGTIESRIAYGAVRGAVFARLEAEKGFPFAKKSSEFRDAMLDDVNPLWLATPVAKAWHTAKEAANVKAMVPIVSRMMEAAQAGEYGAFARAALPLYGRDTFGRSFWEGFRGIAAEGTSADDVAHGLYSLGHRAPHAGIHTELSLAKVPSFFKRGGEGIATNIRDLAYEMMKGRQRLSASINPILASIPEAEQAVANEALYLLKTVPRTAPVTALADGAWDTSTTINSFVTNYREGVATGKVKPVSDKALEYASMALDNTTRGWNTGSVKVNWNPLLSPSKKLAERAEGAAEVTEELIGKPWLRPAQEPAEFIQPDRLKRWIASYRTHEQVVDEANGLLSSARVYGENIDEAIKAAQERITLAQQIKEGKRIPLPDPTDIEQAKASLDRAKAKGAWDRFFYGVDAKQSMAEQTVELARINQEIKLLQRSNTTTASKLMESLERPVQGLSKADLKRTDAELLDQLSEATGKGYKRREALLQEVVRRKEVQALKESGDWDILKEWPADKWNTPQGQEYARGLMERVFSRNKIASVVAGLEGTGKALKQEASIAAIKAYERWSGTIKESRAQILAAQGKLDEAGKVFDASVAVHRRMDILEVERLAASGPRAWEEAALEIAEMKRQREGVKRIITDFKTGANEKDWITELGKAEPVVLGRVIQAYDYATSMVRRSQLWTVGTQAANAIDTNLVKNMLFGGVIGGDDIIHAAKTGEVAPRYGLLGENLVEKFSSNVAALAFDVPPPSSQSTVGRALGAVEDVVAQGVNLPENVGRVTLGGHAYEQITGKLIDMGMDVASASRLGMTEAARFVDLVHVDYANLSPVERGLRRLVFLYPRFNFNDAANLTTLALNNGSEAYALSRIREEQQKESLTGDGSIALGGVLTDPFANVSPVRFHDSTVNLTKSLVGDDRWTVSAMKGVQLAFGGASPIAESFLQATGIKETKNQAALSKYDNFIAAAGNAIGREFGIDFDFAPSDTILGPLGMKPRAAREKALKMASQWEQAMALRGGKLLEPEAAEGVALYKKAARAALSLVSPVTIRDVGLSEVDKVGLQLVRDGNAQIDAAPPELKDIVRENLLASDDYKGLKPFLRKTPLVELEAQAKDATYGVIVRDTLGGAIQKDENTISGRAFKAFGNYVHGVGQVLQGQIIPSEPAPAGVMREVSYPTTSHRNPVAYQGVDFAGRYTGSKAREILENGGAVKAAVSPQSEMVSIKIDGATAEDNANITGLLNYTIRPAVLAADSPEDIKAIIDEFPGGRNFVFAAASVNQEIWGRAAQMYRAAETGGVEGGYAEAPVGSSVIVTRNAVRGWLERRIREAPSVAEAKRLSSLDRQGVIQELKSDAEKGSGPVGLDLSAGGGKTDRAESVMSDLNYRYITGNMDMGKLLYIAERKQIDGIRKDVPDFDAWRSAFKEASMKDPAAIPELVRKARGQSPKILSGLRDIDRETYREVAMWSDYEDIQKVGEYISDFSGGQFRGIHTGRLQQVLAHGKGPEVSVLWGRGDAGMRKGLTRASQVLAQAKEAGLSEVILPQDFSPDDPMWREGMYEQNFDMGNGLSVNPLAESVGGRVPTAPALVPEEIQATSKFLFGEGRASLPPPQLGDGAFMARSQPFGSITDYLKHSEGTYQLRSAQYAKGQLPVPPDRRLIYGENLRYQRYVTTTGPDGKQVTGAAYDSAVPWASSAQAVVTLGRIGAGLGGEATPTEVNAGLTAAGTALSTYAALSALTTTTAVVGTTATVGAAGAITASTPLLAAGPPGWIAFAAIAVATLAGLNAAGVFGGGGEGKKIAAQRARDYQDKLRREQEQEQLRVQGIRNMQQREQSLAQAYAGQGQRQPSPQLQERLAQFRVRPSYGSRLGLIDQVERELGSALKPKY